MPLSIVVTAGNVNDCTAFPDVLAGIRVPRLGRDVGGADRTG